MRLTHVDEIRFAYGYLGDGQSEVGQVCPACKGGSTQEGSLSVTRRGGQLLFKCHRASCSFHGHANVAGGGGGKGQDSKPRRPYPLIKTYPIDAAYLVLLATKYGVPRESLENAELRWTGDRDGHYGRRVCFPIFGPDSEERGACYRNYQDDGRTKSINELRSPDDVAACWYKWQRKSDTLVIVEDQMSAIKIAPVCHSLALMGTHFSEDKMEEVVAGGYKNVRLSLDRDAVGEAIKLQFRYRSKIPGLLVASIEKDIKNMNDEEFKKYVSTNLP